MIKNKQIWIRLLLFFSTGIQLIYLLVSQKYLNYVTPRLKPYLIFSCVIFFIWIILDLLSVFKNKAKNHKTQYVILIALVICQLLPHRIVSSSSIMNNYIGRTAYLGVNSESRQNNNPDIALLDIDEKNKLIRVSTENFAQTLSALHQNIDKYEGYVIEMTGFIYMDSDVYEDNTFMLARLMMTCCVADLTPVGLICTYDKTSTLSPDTWVKVRGILYDKTLTFNGTNYTDLYIDILDITQAEPIEEFIYRS